MKKQMIDGATNAQLNAYLHLAQQRREGRSGEDVRTECKEPPTDPNAQDSLGEGYMMNDQKDLAITPENVKANSARC